MKEYIERDRVRFEFERFFTGQEGVQHDCDSLLCTLPAADVVEVFRGEDSVLSEFENHYKDFEKIKTHLAQIIVEGKVEKPYYSILWFDEEGKEYCVGYSSYCLDYVRKWLELVFEVVDATPNVVERKRGEWTDYRYVRDYDEYEERCSSCHEWSLLLGKKFCPNCGSQNTADMRSHQMFLCDQEEGEHEH